MKNSNVYNESLSGFLIAALTAAFILFISGCAGTGTNPISAADTDKDPILRVGLSICGVPQLLSKTKNGQLKGLEIDILQAFAKEHKYILETDLYPENELFFALRRGEVDIAVPCSTDTVIKSSFLDVCVPHLKTGQRVLVNNAVSMFIQNKEQLDKSDITVLSPVDSPAADFANTIFPAAEKVSLKDLKSCMKKALSHNGSVIMLNSVEAYAATHTPGGEKKSAFTTVLPPLTEENICWAVRQNENEMKQELDHFIKRIKSDGTLKKMIEENNAEIINE